MIRKTLYITEEQNKYLKDNVLNDSEVIRRALDEYIKKNK